MCAGFDYFINSVCIQNKQDKEQQSTAGELPGATYRVCEILPAT